MAQEPSKLAQRIERAERPMLGLAAFAVAIYLLELRGVWMALGVEPAYQALSLVVDLIFCADLVVKIVALGRPYVRSPWFAVDLISALPVISSLAQVPDLVHALRFMRGFRMFRILRTLRVLRSLPGIRGAVPLTGQTRTPEARAYKRALLAAVLVYAATFVVLLAWIRASVPEAQAHDTEFFLVLGSLLGMALILFVVRFQLPDLWARQMRALLNVALPFQVAEHFMDHPEGYDITVRMPATVIFCDIRGFTSTVEALGGDLDTLKHHLERAMDVVVEVHRGEDLIVDKFIGDAIMSFRGGNLVTGDAREHAHRVVRATLGSVKALRELEDPYFNQMKIGGASADHALIGTFGTSNRLSYTILGDRVNLAARLEAACNYFGVMTLFCDRTRALCDDLPGLVWRPIGQISVQGKDEPVRIFEVFDAAHEPEELSWVPVFEEALAAYEAQDFAAADRLFRQVDGARPSGDETSRIYLRLCERYAHGAPEGWAPLIRTSK